MIATTTTAAAPTQDDDNVSSKRTSMNLKAAATLYSSLSSSTTRTMTTTTSRYNGHLKGVFCGSGSDMMSDPRTCRAILELVPTKRQHQQPIQVVYLGTATYDLEVFQHRQTSQFLDYKCQVTPLRVSEPSDQDETPSFQSYLKEVMNKADVIVVGGGNTLYALDRWQRVGLDVLLQQAMKRGAVLSGGSAGAICWFDGGHSNAMDPGTYKKQRIQKYSSVDPTSVGDELDMCAEYNQYREWKYIRVPALGYLPGIVSPHHDRTQSNGLYRGDDFDRCLLTTPGEVGIGIDHWAGLIVDGPDYEVFSFLEKDGSVGPNGEFCKDGSGQPGVWIKNVVDGKVVQRLCPPKGKVADLLRPAEYVVNDEEALERCRRENPSQQNIQT